VKYEEMRAMTEDVGEPIRYDVPGAFHTILVWRYSHHAQWAVVDVFATDDDGLCFINRMEDYADDADDSDPLRGDVVVSGSTKWDGCTNFSTDDECAAHTCGPEGMMRFARSLQTATLMALESMDSDEVTAEERAVLFDWRDEAPTQSPQDAP
jgi:hypothetical protein